jgi:hypothetical protein
VSVVFLTILHDPAALGVRFLPVCVVEERDLLLTAECEQFVICLLVACFAASEVVIAADVWDTNPVSVSRSVSQY